jgi:hypothetical protein
MPQGPGPFEWEKNKNTSEWEAKELEPEKYDGRKTISDFAPLFRNLAQTSHYEVKFGGLPLGLTTFLAARGVDSDFITDDFGLLCTDAYIPTSYLMTSTVRGNYTGMIEKFAQARNYGENLSLTFYVDRNYKSIMLLESWIEYISSGSYTSTNSSIITQPGYFSRIQYPDDYKSDKSSITKFDKDYKKLLTYTFIGLFPSQMDPITVSYNESQILKVSATFSYDRYIVTPVG